MYYFRDKEGHEIDLIIERDGQIFPIEIKSGAKIGADDIKHINYLRKIAGNAGTGAVISLSADFMPINRDCYNIPVGCIG